MSIKGSTRSVLALVEFVKASGFHLIYHGLIAASWYFFFNEEYSNDSLCVSTEHVDAPIPAVMTLLSLDSLYRQVVFTMILLVLGSTLEARLGSAYFLSVILGNSILMSVMVKNIFPSVCFPGQESLVPVLTSLAVLLHGNNPKISTEAYGHSVRTTFAVEPRWFAWFLIGLFVLFENRRNVLLLYSIGMAVGTIPWISTILINVWETRNDRKRILKIFRALQLFVSVSVFPFTLSSIEDFPFTGPTIMFDRDLIVTDWFSLLSLHLLVLSPIFILLDNKQRVMPFVVILSILAWIYCTQSPYFVHPGPGLMGIGLVAYSAIWFH